jgi:hypothetical protein
VTDQNTGCKNTISAQIIDETRLPVVVVTQDNPLTNCDPPGSAPTFLNGQLAATADGGIVGYTFNWFRTPVTAGSVSIGDNDKLIGEDLGTYQVRAVNTLTFCVGVATGTITDGRVNPPVPLALATAPQSNCDLSLSNGRASAAVIKTAPADTVTVGYTFDWYDGPAPGSNPDFTGINYLSLASGEYSVIAEDVGTRCRSNPATVAIADSTKTYSIRLKATPAYCLDSGRPPQGSIVAEIAEASSSNILIDKVIWTRLEDNTVVSGETGTQIFGLYPGLYRANATTSENCPAEAEVEVPTEIGAFNGISRNADNKNDKFIIDCISLFPNNIVKIYNRSGILVYQGEFYDNSTIFFDGVGINGFYLQGNELPDGTYFYVIDKRDGSKPISGYLELTR